MKNEILVQGMEVVVISKGEHHDRKGKIVKLTSDRDNGNTLYKIRFDISYGMSPGTRNTYYRWLGEADIIPANDDAYKMLFGD